MKYLFCILSIIVVLSCLVSCSSKSNSVIPDAEGRLSQFFNPPVQLFSSADPEEDYIKDIDLCTLVAGPGFGQYEPGDIYLDIPWDSSYDATFSAGVSTRVYEDEYGVLKVPWYSWLVVQGGEESHTTAEGLALIPEYGDNYFYEYNLPKCDAICFPTHTSPLGDIELAVCYQMRKVYNPQNKGKWVVGVTINSWQANPGYFPLTEPDQSRHWIFGDPDGICQYRFPDIAFDTYSGDLYLVYTFYEPLFDHAIVYYHRFDRQTGEWNGPYGINGLDHGAWTPRIDIGLLEDPMVWPPDPDEVENRVVVVYSAFGEGEHYGRWHPYLVSWEVDEGDGSKAEGYGFSLLSEKYEDYNAGLPVVDIAPNSNLYGTHKGAVVYVQQIAGDPWEPDDPENVYRVHEIDNFMLGRTEIIYDAECEKCSSFDPSITIHYNEESEINIASVSWFESTKYEVNNYIVNYPCVCNIVGL